MQNLYCSLNSRRTKMQKTDSKIRLTWRRVVKFRCKTHLKGFQRRSMMKCPQSTLNNRTYCLFHLILRDSFGETLVVIKPPGWVPVKARDIYIHILWEIIWNMKKKEAFICILGMWHALFNSSSGLVAWKWDIFIFSSSWTRGWKPYSFRDVTYCFK